MSMAVGYRLSLRDEVIRSPARHSQLSIPPTPAAADFLNESTRNLNTPAHIALTLYRFHTAL